MDGGDIQIATYRPDKQKWNKPKSLKGDVGSDAEETTAALTPDGKELYFVSTNPKLSRGGKDIMVSKFSPPQILHSVNIVTMILSFNNLLIKH